MSLIGFAKHHDQPNLTVLADHCCGKLILQIAASTPPLGGSRLHDAKSQKKWWRQTGSNRRPHACKARALPTELWPQGVKPEVNVPSMVGLGRLERPTSPLSGVRSNHLSYRPSTIKQHGRHKVGPILRSRYLVRKRNEGGICPANGL